MAEKDMQGQYAGFVSRANGLIIDIALVYIIIIAVTWLTHGALSLVGVDISNCPVQSDKFWLNIRWATCLLSKALVVAFAALTPSVYYILMWSLGGQTIGDYIVGIKVVRTDGGDVGLVRAFIRWLGFLLCVASLGIGFLWVIIDDKRQGWHDKLARTCVVYAWQARVDEAYLKRLQQWARARQAKRDERSLS